METLAAEAPTGVEVVDSPVTGAVDGARTGRLTLFAGGLDAALALAVPTLANLGRVIEFGGAPAVGVGAELPMTRAAHAVFADAGERYGTDVGELHVAKRLEDDAGFSFRMAGEWTPPWEV